MARLKKTTGNVIPIRQGALTVPTSAPSHAPSSTAGAEIHLFEATTLNAPSYCQKRGSGASGVPVVALHSHPGFCQACLEAMSTTGKGRDRAPQPVMLPKAVG